MKFYLLFNFQIVLDLDTISSIQNKKDINLKRLEIKLNYI